VQAAVCHEDLDLPRPVSRSTVARWMLMTYGARGDTCSSATAGDVLYYLQVRRDM
jgi:hypothetical protein